MISIDKASIDGIWNRAMPIAWRDLSRDWSCWSMAERAFAVTMVSSAPTLLLIIVYVLA